MLLIKIKNHESHIEFLKNNIKTDLWYFVHIGIYNKIKCHNLNTYINSRTVRFEFNCINCVNYNKNPFFFRRAIGFPLPGKEGIRISRLAMASLQEGVRADPLRGPPAPCKKV